MSELSDDDLSGIDDDEPKKESKKEGAGDGGGDDELSGLDDDDTPAAAKDDDDDLGGLDDDDEGEKQPEAMPEADDDDDLGGLSDDDDDNANGGRKRGEEKDDLGGIDDDGEGDGAAAKEAKQEAEAKAKALKVQEAAKKKSESEREAAEKAKKQEAARKAKQREAKAKMAAKKAAAQKKEKKEEEQKKKEQEERQRKEAAEKEKKRAAAAAAAKKRLAEQRKRKKQKELEDKKLREEALQKAKEQKEKEAADRKAREERRRRAKEAAKRKKEQKEREMAERRRAREEKAREAAEKKRRDSGEAGSEGEGDAAVPPSEDYSSLSPEDLESLNMLDQTVANFSNQGDDLQAIEAMEMSLLFRRKHFGLSSPQTYVYREKVAKEYNRLSVVFMEKDQMKLSADLLEKAQILGELYPNVLAVTYNNLGCYYRKKGKNRTALNYLKEALNVESAIATPHLSPETQGVLSTMKLPAMGPIHISDTHLNLCAIYSDLARHKDAHHHIRMAIRHLQLEMYGRILRPEEHADELKVKDDTPQDRRVTFTAAYFNLAVQQEFLGKWASAQKSYQTALKLLDVHDIDGALADTIHAAYQQAQPKLRKRIKDNIERSKQRAHRLNAIRTLTKRVKKVSSDTKKHGPRKVKKSPDKMDAELEARLRQWSMYESGGAKPANKVTVRTNNQLQQQPQLVDQ
uniref:Uncharacterized protein n=1 Tax=Lotharella globosa TaxID=91324 RepID=A0A7S3YP45_9EUKA|mmetsp:Transcript_1925/g.3736  ORF Transcript_1925/g.3736 Transcript_1925/m.3736 type:complete len:687 (+) Transcript_1925:124-2184(+)|eukprot:CAMPEP_0167823176 /NCGR_PEP_ID=MMETSP0112_2-20121227/7965_1 /TAXON_ID=91324 /ORGANISM="Lotharella globosa, Strain CCCM811" /LENGTH=686 /DNA_ID=CAMNT_0007724743 /DNA_START=56 /DNA_END=2116 /DNA_ORIENTATION=-